MGWIPEEWECTTLGIMAAPFRAGVSVNADDRPARDGECGVLKTSCVYSGVFNPQENKVVKTEEIDRVRVPVQRGCVIMSRMNTPTLVGANAYVDQDWPTMFLPDRLWLIKPENDSRDDPIWFGYLMNATIVRNAVAARATGTSGSMKNVTQEDVRRIHVPRPQKEEQIAMSLLLLLWGQSIACVEEMLKAKKLRKKGLMQQLLTGKSRLPGFAGEWKERRLGDLFTERRETGRCDLPLLAITGSKGIVPAVDLDRKDASNQDKSKYLRICPGDIGYNTMRMWQGVNAVSSLEGIVSPAYTICTPKDYTHVGFMGHFFKYQFVVHQFWRHSQGLVDDTLSLKYHNFACIKLYVPEKEEQEAIALILDAADEEIAAEERRLLALQDQKRGLMQKLLTGEVRVKV